MPSSPIKPTQQDLQDALVLRERLRKSLAQAEAGELAPGSGEDAIRGAFAEARIAARQSLNR